MKQEFTKEKLKEMLKEAERNEAEAAKTAGVPDKAPATTTASADVAGKGAGKGAGNPAVKSEKEKREGAKAVEPLKNDSTPIEDPASVKKDGATKTEDEAMVGTQRGTDLAFTQPGEDFKEEDERARTPDRATEPDKAESDGEKTEEAAPDRERDDRSRSSSRESSRVPRKAALGARRLRRPVVRNRV